MGKYFNVSPATGTGGLAAQEASVTPTSDFTGRGPVTENVVVEYQGDAEVKQTRLCTRTGTTDTISNLNSTLKFEKVASTSDTIPASGWENVALESLSEETSVASIPLAACWIRISYKANLKACDFLANRSKDSAKEAFSKFYIRINGKYFTSTGELVSSATEYPQKAVNENGATLNVAGDPGLTSRMNVEIIAKCTVAAATSSNLIGSIWSNVQDQSKLDAPINSSVVFMQDSSASGLSVTPASLDFGTSTAEKKISITSLKPWKAYIE